MHKSQYSNESISGSKTQASLGKLEPLVAKKNDWPEIGC